jgi:hypothetical protein
VAGAAVAAQGGYPEIEEITMTIDFLPQPHRIAWAEGKFLPTRHGVIGISDQLFMPVVRSVQALLPGYALAVTVGRIHDQVTIRLRRGLKPGGYRLTVRPAGIVLEAASAAAAGHGVQTLRQLMAQCPSGSLPCVAIDDWPDFQDRGVYYDVCRGRVPTLASLLQQADLLAQFKINHLELYVEHTFHFRGHPDIGRGASPLTADDLLSLDQHCADRNIELVPSLASFGHMSQVLKHPQYHDLAEDWGVGKYLDPEAERHIRIKGWTLSPANPLIYPFLDSLFAEFLPLFRSKRFNVCCDETFDLGLGQSYELCRRRGKGRVYLDHILKLRNLAQRHGKRILFWGDIIRNHPKLIREIPKDVTILDWGYDANHPFDKVRDFKAVGCPFIVCPGTNSWNALFPRLFEAQANIHGFAAAGKKHGAQGLMNTDWGDGGHANFMELSWHGYLFGAEQAWNVAADQASFTRRFCKLFLGCDDSDLVGAVTTLGDLAQVGTWGSVWQTIFFAAPGDRVFAGAKEPISVSRGGAIRKIDGRIDARLGRETAERLIGVRTILEQVASRSGADPHGVLPYWLFAVDTLRHAALKLAALGRGGRNTFEARALLREDQTRLMRRFEKLWLARNRPSEIGITLKRYRQAIRALG